MNVIMGKFSSKRNKDFWNEFALTSKDNKFGASGGRHLVDIENQFIFNSNLVCFTSPVLTLR